MEIWRFLLSEFILDGFLGRGERQLPERMRNLSHQIDLSGTNRQKNVFPIQSEKGWKGTGYWLGKKCLIFHSIVTKSQKNEDSIDSQAIPLKKYRNFWKKIHYPLILIFLFIFLVRIWCHHFLCYFCCCYFSPVRGTTWILFFVVVLSNLSVFFFGVFIA